MAAETVVDFRSALADVQQDMTEQAEDVNSLISQSFNMDADFCIAWALRKYVNAIS